MMINFKNNFAFIWCIYGERIIINCIAFNIKCCFFIICWWFCNIKTFISFRILNFKSFFNIIFNMRNIRSCWSWYNIAITVVVICNYTSNFKSFICRNLFFITSNTIKIAEIKNINHTVNTQSRYIISHLPLWFFL